MKERKKFILFRQSMKKIHH